MTMVTRKSFQNLASAFLAIVALAVIAQAQTPALSTTIKIKNFGQMDERFYRGAQPKDIEDYKALAALGIKTIIDLQDDAKEYEKPMAESVGIKYVQIPMIAKKYPTEEAIATFLKVVGDPSTGKFYLHCAGGRHRTGAMGAVYRYKFYNWNFEQVYKEMKQYDFYTSWGHGAFKDFVKAYYAQMTTASTSAPAAEEASTVKTGEKK
ncbi:MAG TPA: tyrosine-protein phosphatase [Pyrinomonadaceae bacterium]|nr:tyrosine-protein phosphatase [Pyrinomonadaceae bacterium]